MSPRLTVTTSATLNRSQCNHTGPTPQPLSPKPTRARRRFQRLIFTCTQAPHHNVPCPPDQPVLPHTTTCPQKLPHSTTHVPRSCPTAQHMSPEAAPQHNTCPLNQLVHTGVSNADCNMHIGSTLQLVIVHQIKSSCPKPQPKPTRATPHHNPYPPNQLVLLHTTNPIHQTTLSTNSCYPTPNPLSPKLTPYAPHHNPYPPSQLVHAGVSNADYNVYTGPTPQPLSTQSSGAV